MKKIIFPQLCIALSCWLFTVTAFTQVASKNNTASVNILSTGKGLFETDKIVEISLSGNTRELLNDRSQKPQYHPMNFLYTGEDSIGITIPVEVKTRGHFRKLKDNCTYPPLLVHFIKSDILKSTIFKSQDKLKLVMPCQGDQYVVREWMVYKLYNLVTPKSFRARLVRVKLTNTQNDKSAPSFYGILLEEEKQLAKRNGVTAVNKKIQPDQTDPEDFLSMAVFEYLIGNTDWSVQYLQNIKLLALDSNAIPSTVPYDFDHAGIVNAPYAIPTEALLLNSVRKRRYRGYCIRDMKQFDPVTALYNKLKKDIYGLYTGCALLDEKYKKATIKYLDEFYETINNPVKLQKEFGYPCDKNGTGNVVIKSLRED